MPAPHTPPYAVRIAVDGTFARVAYDPADLSASGEALSRAVGGALEALYGDHLVFWMDEHYTEKGLPLNVTADTLARTLRMPGYGNALCGPVVVTGRDGEDVAPLPVPVHRALLALASLGGQLDLPVI